MTRQHDIDPLGATAAGEEAETAGLSDSAKRAIEQDTLIREGAILQHFKVEGLLGKGAMGAVYSAHDESLDRPVALKVLPTELAQDETFIERFVREARAQAKLSHPNVVPIYFIGEQDSRWFFAMEKVEGESLDDMLERGETLDWEQALDVAEAVASALGMAQDKDLIHRDIKPSNILLTTDGFYKVADFGLAKPAADVTEDDKKLTQDGAFVGTPLYVAPEQARGESIDHRVDMYALGATLYHLVAGKPVFDGDSLIAIIAKHASEPPDLNALVAPDEFKSLVGRLLAKKPEARFGSWAQVTAEVALTRPTDVHPGSMVSRYFANAVDLLLVTVVTEIIVPGDGFMWILAPILAIYVIGATAWRGRTLGKWLFRLEVVDADGATPTWWQATARTLITWVPAWYLAGIMLWVTSPRFDGVEGQYTGELSELPAFMIPVATLPLVPVILAFVAFAYSRNKHRRTHADRIAGTRVLQR